MAKKSDVETIAPPVECTEEEGRAMFDAAARRHLGISGDEFLRMWDAGEFADDPDRPEVLDVAMLIPFAR